MAINGSIFNVHYRILPFMKHLISLFFFLFAANCCVAQNMVPNGDFEQYTSCPSGRSQITRATGWTDFAPSTDYFNVCAISNVGVPTNNMGTQWPTSGNGYAGLSYSPYAGNGREAFTCSITPLTVGVTYSVSMSVSLAEISNCGLTGLGAFFFDNGPTSIGPSPVAIAAIVPQVSFSSYGPISDQINWVRVKANFIADSAYDNIAITGFGPASSFIVDTISSIGTSMAYYYIDSIVVKRASGINNLYADTMICAGDTFQVPYTTNSNTLFSSGNVFSVQLSDATGSFVSGTTTIGTRASTVAGSITCVVPNTIVPSNYYRIRIRSTNNVDSSDENDIYISVGVTRPVINNTSNSPICTSTPLHLYTTSNVTGVSYKWTGPAGFNSTLQNPIINSATTANSGNYIVTARLYGCVSKDTTNVYVSVGNPSQVAAYSNTSICTYDTVKLNATVQVAANSYTWTGPQSFTSSNKDTIFASTSTGNSGNYIFTAYYTGCTVRDTVSMLVKPVASNRVLSVNSTTICSGKTLLLSASSSTSGVNYSWQGPNSFSAATQNVTQSNINTNMTGRYTVAYELNGCTVKDSVSVIVNPSPSAIIASTNAPVCQNDTVRLYSTNSSSGVVWNWSCTGGFASSSKDTLFTVGQPSQSGYYVVSATNNYNCKAIDSVYVLVKPLPANVNAGTNAPICEGNTLFLTGNTSTSGVSFSWTGPNSFSSTLQNPNFSSATTTRTGNYILAATLNGCTVLDTVYAAVNSIPLTPTPSANTPVCVGQDLQLGASAIAGATYAWTSTTGFTSTIQNPVRTAATTSYAGKYYVTATANGCTSARDSIMVTVNPAPVINVYPSPKDSICVGQTVTFVSSNSNAGSSYVRSWFKNSSVIGGAANANYSTTTAADGDEYYVTLTAYGVCATPFTDTSNVIKMHVLPYLVPTVSIAANPNATVKSGTMINFTATPTNGGSRPAYQWLVNGSYIIGAISNVWGASTLSNNDVICAEMTSSYMCANPKKAKSDCIKVSIESTGIVGVWRGKEPSIYPNPTKDRLIIEGVEKGTKVQLNDVLGSVLIKSTATSGTAELNMSHLAAGNYLLLLSTDNGDRMSVKVVKE